MPRAPKPESPTAPVVSIGTFDDAGSWHATYERDWRFWEMNQLVAMRRDVFDHPPAELARRIQHSKISKLFLPSTLATWLGCEDSLLWASMPAHTGAEACVKYAGRGPFGAWAGGRFVPAAQIVTTEADQMSPERVLAAVAEWRELLEDYDRPPAREYHEETPPPATGG